MTRHCHRCGWEWKFTELPGRSETCPQCRTDLRVCLNCHSHEAYAAYQCRDRRAEPVGNKEQGTFCEYFEFARRNWTGAGEDARASAARSTLRGLLGD